MAQALKHFFDAALVRSIGRELRSAHRRFDEPRFVRACLAGLDQLELTARARHVAKKMHEHLPRDFEQAANVIVDSLGPELDRTEGFGFAPFRYLPHVYFVAEHGLGDFEASMRAQYELTKRFSAEFSIRAFLVEFPEATHERLSEWAKDTNVHVRRLVSEGTRPRLPWAPRLEAFQADPRPVIELLELLRDDPERYVQRSVANNLNDIGKDHPDVAIAVCRRWSLQASPERRWIVEHALRSLVKAGHQDALCALGIGTKPKVEIGRIRLVPKRVRLGKKLSFSFELTSLADRIQELQVDYAVHFVKANGTTRPKVFKLRRLALSPRAGVELTGRVSFERMTTRRAHPGRHRIELLINGVPRPFAEFDVRV